MIAAVRVELSFEIHMDDNPKFHHKLFESSNGSIYSRMKMIGENNVPFGCFYDPSDRFEAFAKRVKDSILLALELAERELQMKFTIQSNDIIYDAYIGGQWTKNIPLQQVRRLIGEFLIYNGDEDFSLQLVVNCKRQISPNDVQVWGTLVDIDYLRDELYDKMEDENYPVWVISIEGITTTIDDPYTDEELGQICSSIVNQAKADFNEYYS